MMFSPLHTVIRTLGATLALSAVTLTPAHAFSDDEARKAILELRQQVRQMSDQGLQARIQLADRIEILQQEVASLRGQVEQLRWQAEQSAAQNTDTPSVQSNDPIEQATYDAAMELFRNGQYAEAASGFGDFLNAYPSSSLAAEAQFYRGSSLYATKNFKDSISTLQSLVQTAPDDARAPDALLVVAASQIELNSMNGARTTLQQIVKDYPQSNAAETAKSRLKLLQ